ncbi:MAG: hypothetical protein ACYCW6_00675 [Candidatus Xenobia bacterium]
MVINSGGHRYQVPDGGWVTRQQQQHPDTRTWVNDPEGWRHDGDWHHDSDDWCRERWGDDWHDHDRGFYCGDNFWFGFEMGEMGSWDWDRPVYVVSPVTGEPCGTLPAPDPDSGLDAQQQAYLNELGLMANPQQDPNNPDPTGGLYVASPNFDPNNPGGKLDAPTAYNMLNSNQPIYFHPPNGDWESLQRLSDLDAYLYTQEQRDQAPPQTVESEPDASQTPPPDGTAPAPEPAPAPAPASPPGANNHGHWWDKVGDWFKHTF